MLVFAAIALGWAGQVSASEYFPLEPGVRWHYVERSEGRNTTFVDEVKPPVKIAERTCVPIETRTEGKPYETRYYNVQGDTVLLVAYDPSSPLDPPIPILKLASHKTDWTYAGFTIMLTGSVPLEFKATGTPKGKRKILDVERECYEVVMDAKIDGGRGLSVRSVQIALYARGVGLVEMKQQTTVGTKTTESTTKLIKFEAPA